MKVMTSLWGAGQMMFNKIMVVLSRDVDLSDYKAVAREVTQMTDPLQDIHFIKGPVDILDHSSRHFSFGSKMGIDATVKWPEESEGSSSNTFQPFIDTLVLQEKFPEVIAVNETFLTEGISLVVLSVKKKRINHVREISAEFMKQGLLRDIKFLLFLDSEVDIHSPADIAWIAASNIDPMRDCFHPVSDNGTSFPVLALDGTRKTAGYDGFTRDWPNIIVMDEPTIRKVDEKWEKYGLGSLVPSPSRKYRSLIINDGAMVHEGF
jgi:4-hydroxy-3-polyprenylbenzoate decarboxylase